LCVERIGTADIGGWGKVVHEYESVDGSDEHAEFYGVTVNRHVMSLT
jgi:hypothetical protein